MQTTYISLLYFLFSRQTELPDSSPSSPVFDTFLSSVTICCSKLPRELRECVER